MRFRRHHGGLATSMETQVELEPTRQAICDHINATIADWGVPKVKPEDLRLGDPVYDDRIGWHNCWVSINGFGVFGSIDHKNPGEIP